MNWGLGSFSPCGRRWPPKGIGWGSPLFRCDSSAIAARPLIRRFAAPSPARGEGNYPFNPAAHPPPWRRAGGTCWSGVIFRPCQVARRRRSRPLTSAPRRSASARRAPSRIAPKRSAPVRFDPLEVGARRVGLAQASAGEIAAGQRRAGKVGQLEVAAGEARPRCAPPFSRRPDESWPWRSSRRGDCSPSNAAP